MAYGRSIMFSCSTCRAWPTSRSGQPLAKRRSGRPVLLLGPMRQTDERRSRASSDADPLANCVRTIMGERGSWTGTASDLLRLCAESAREDTSMKPPWAKNPRALAGRLRRAQTFLSGVGVEITFSREGRTGSRMIRVSTKAETCVSSASLVTGAEGNGARGDQAMMLG
jgi:hypothetical protein